jgi:hypothetical protein
VITKYYKTTTSSNVLREEDTTWPMSYDPFNDLEPHEIFAGLEKIIQKQDKLGKDPSKAKDKENKEFAKCFKMM